MALVLWSAMGPERWWLAAPGVTKAVALTGLVFLGGATYFACLWLLGIRPQEFARRAA
jgi:putative peptidoglycan lipid II flippase